MKGLRYFLAVLLVVLVGSVAMAATLEVGLGKPYGTIQEAIIAANEAVPDSVLVYPGTYPENITFGGKNIRVASTGGAKVTIINGGANGRVVTFANGENSSTQLDGFTITNGAVAGQGAGIYCDNSGPTLRNLVISGNSASWGGGLYFGNATPTLQNVAILGNTSSGVGGGIFSYKSTASLVNVLISGNSTTGGTSSPGGGICAQFGSNLNLVNVTIANNTCVTGTVSAISTHSDSPVSLVNSIVWNHAEPRISGNVIASYSNVEGSWAGTGNINADPRFVGGIDYHLQCGSPCIDAGNNDAVPGGVTTDLDGNPRFIDDPGISDTGNGTPPIVDMGAYESSLVSFMCAWNPNPADGASCVDPNVVLSWTPGCGAVKHDVYFGVNYADVADATTSTAGIFKGRQDPNSYNPPGVLDVPCKTYYWRIDEVSLPNIWKGDVWSFTTKGDDCCCIAPPEGMVAWWPLDETVGNTSKELVYGNDGTWMGSPIPLEGKVNGALSFDGVSDYVKVPDDEFLNFGTGDLSIDAWVKTSDANYIKIILEKRSGQESLAHGYQLYLWDGKLGLLLADGHYTQYRALALPSAADGNWHHVAATVHRDEPDGLKLYVDCISQTFNPMDRQGSLDNDGNLLIGAHRYNSTLRFKGDIDEVELFNRALDANEICAIFEAGSAGKCKCECGQWDSLQVTSWATGVQPSIWTGNCGDSVVIYSAEGKAITATSSIACAPESCDPSYGWQVTGPGGFSDSGDQLPAEFIPLQDGTYEVKFLALCNSQECPPCNITLNVKIIRTAPSYPNNIKWSQPPKKDDNANINGWDELSSYKTEPIIADDWLCKDDRPIKDIHWWGSFKGWKEDKLPPDAPAAFHIGIWTDVPDPDPNNPNTFSHPRKLIWENICNCSVWSSAGYDLDPRGEGENDACFKFDQLLSEDQWFYQESNEPNGTVYWLSIAAIYDGNTPEHPWGWKTRPHFYNDDAVRILPPVAFCPNDCPNPNYSVFVGGINDNFSTQYFEPATPSPALAAILTSPTDFDESDCDYQFGHTITGLPECIVRAELEIALKGVNWLACNDTISLQLTGGSFAWGRRIGTGTTNEYSYGCCDGPNGLLLNPWESKSQTTFLLDLSALPNLGGKPATNLLPLLNSTGHLDVYIQDDTAVDYMILHVWSCPLVTGQWPPVVGSFWENGVPIEYPEGTSWDMAFALTTNREYPEGVRKSADINGDGTVDLKDLAILSAQWLDP